MKMSIATVSFERRACARSSRRSRRQASKASRFSRTTSRRSTARRPMCASMVGDLGLEIVAFQPFRDFEGMPAGKRERIFARAERKFDLMQELGCDLLLVCSNVSPESARRHRPRRRRPPRARRAGGQARAAHRLRGARLGPPHQRLSRRLGGRAPRRPSGRGLVLDTLPHPGAQDRPQRRSRSIPRDKIFLVQVADAPALDMDPLSWSRHFRNFPGQGDLPLLDFMDGLARHRLRRARCRWRSSTTSSGRARRAALRSTATAR